MALIPRVIPTLLIDGETFVKTIRYDNPTYVGDPINVINLFNRFEVDEIVILDIGATESGRGPNYDLLKALSAECWVPLTYGGGLQSIDQVGRVLSIGVEKVVLGTALGDHPDLVRDASDAFGSQAVVASVDARTRDAGSSYEAFVTNAKRPLGIGPVDLAKRAQELGAGEILLNAIDRDGAMAGYDIGLIRDVASAVGVPVIASGGAGKRSDLRIPIAEGRASAVAAGSLFVFSGSSRGVLINFPRREELERLLAAETNGSRVGVGPPAA
jgi:cyclase